MYEMERNENLTEFECIEHRTNKEFNDLRVRWWATLKDLMLG